MSHKTRRASALTPLFAVILLIACAVVLAHTVIDATRTRAASALQDNLSSTMVRQTIRIQQRTRGSLLATEELMRVQQTADIVRGLSTEQKVAQLFVVTPEALLGGRYDGVVTKSAGLTQEALMERPVGGIIYFQQNLVSADQTKQMLSAAQSYAREAVDVPLLIAVDEEGGTVSRIGGNEGFSIANVGNMSDVGASGDAAYAQEVASGIGRYLHTLGFTTDFAPVADIANNPASDTMRLRSFGSDANLVADMVAAQVRGFASQDILCCVKHFPGIGGAEGDSHDGSIFTHASYDEMAEVELKPFVAAFEAGVPMVMVGHITCPELTGSDLPASVNATVMTELLRQRLGFSGVVITDSLGMGAIVNRFGADRVAVEAFLAGADLLLMPADFDAAWHGMLDAVSSGEISPERLNASVYRIIRMKLAYEGAESL